MLSSKCEIFQYSQMNKCNIYESDTSMKTNNNINITFLYYYTIQGMSRRNCCYTLIENGKKNYFF